ncbi:tail fiber protein [Clavibacter phage CN1A]|uniref:Tail fiber protein n=1 Tax=Clavibacter phage CN1A TaxID=1406793 RepID=U5PXH9_9CAUD|nr:tail fiber protein [Clavibacter phage CN1A]AGY47158.1 tail fiber protein [Clavibacter phage CN1A]
MASRITRSTPMMDRPTWLGLFSTLVKTTSRQRPIIFLDVGDSIKEGYGTVNPVNGWAYENAKEIQRVWGDPSWDDLGFQYIPTYQQFDYPTPNTKWGVQSTGSKTEGSLYGIGRKSAIKYAASSSTWTDMCTSMAVLVYQPAGKTTQIEVYVDDKLIKTHTTTTGSKLYSTGVLPLANRKVTFRYLSSSGAYESGIGVYRGSETKGYQTWVAAKSGTYTANFISSGGANVSNPTNAHLIAAGGIGTPDVISYNWITNDIHSSNGKRTPAQLEADYLQMIDDNEAQFGNKVLHFINTPQELRTENKMDTWENYMKALSRVAAQRDRVLFEPLSDHFEIKAASNDPWYFDGLHPNEAGYRRYGQKTVQILAGSVEGGGSDTTAPTITLVSPAAGATVTGVVPFRVTITDASGVGSAGVSSGNTSLGKLTKISGDTYGLDVDYTKLQGITSWFAFAGDTITPPNTAKTASRAITVASAGGTTPLSLDFSNVGDSLAENYYVNKAKLVAAYPSSTFAVQAKGGYLGTEVAAFQGGHPATAIFPNNTIPAAATATTITLDINLLASPGETGDRSQVVRISGVTGTLRSVKASTGNNTGSYTHTFTRTTAGTAVTIPSTGAQVLLGDEHTGRLMLIQTERNSFHLGTDAQAVTRIQEMMAFNRRPTKDHIVFDIPAADKTIELPGTALRNQLDSRNAALKAAFPNNFVEASKYLQSETIIRKAGLIPTDEDRADIANGFVPASFRSDSVHYNQSAYDMISDLVIENLKARGFAPETDISDKDTTAPILELVSPVAGATVSGTIPFRVRATDATGVSTVQVYSGPGIVGVMSPLGDGLYGLDVDYATMQGKSGWRAIAADTVTPQNTTSSATRALTIAPLPSNQTLPPTITNIKPVGGMKLSGNVTFEATVASAGNKIASVAFFSRGVLIGAGTETTPGVWTLQKVAGSANFPVTMVDFYVVAQDDAATPNTTQSEPVAVTVEEKVVTPPVPVLTAPASNAVLTGTVKFQAVVTDAVGVLTVGFWTGNTPLFPATRVGGTTIWEATAAAGDLPEDLTSVRVRAVNNGLVEAFSNPTPVTVRPGGSIQLGDPNDRLISEAMLTTALAKVYALVNPLSGTSTMRPPAATVAAGTLFYDTTTKVPQWSDGVVWRQADGSVV